MSLELSSIVFKATTDELDAAVKKIEVLGKSVEGLASSLGKLDKASAETNKTQAQANLINAKAEKELAKAIDITDKSVAATERLTKATKEKQSVEERQAAITRIMSDGYSRGQASILATAEAMGEATERTAELLKTQRAMQGVSPFDKSLGAATVFANELRVATVASDLYNKDLGFTKNQLQELGREHVRLTEQFKVQGKSLSGLDAEFNKIVQSAQQVTQAENTMAASMKNADKATMDAGKANAYIENELQKVRFALQANNEELNRSTSNSLVRFENALKKSGLTLDQQREKIDEYRRSQIELQKTQKANQTDYITRAVGPQITDIIVGLSTGQSPLTVMMQQGGQLRDQFGMMGIAAKDMGDVMRNAMKGMASSVFDTGKAITTMLAGGMFDAGKAVVNYASSFLFVDKAIEKARQGIIGMSSDSATAADNLAKFDRIAGGLGGVLGKVFAGGIITIVAALAAVGVAAVQNVNLMNELSQTLVSVGASYGLTSGQVLEYSNAISTAGISTQGSIAAMTLMIKAGAGTAESLKEITLAAMELEKAGGPSVEKISKMYSDLEKDPIKALSELRLNTGLVTDENIKNIESLIEQGDEIRSVEEATRILTEANRTMASQLIADMNPLQVLWMDMKGALSDLWNGVNDLATSSGVVVAFRVVWESVALVIKQVAGSIKGLATGIVAIMSGDFKTAATIFSETWSNLGTNYATAIANTSKTMEGNNALQSEAVKNAQKQVEAEKERLALTKTMKDVKDKDDKLNAKTLTQAQFINKMVEDKNKLLVKGTQLEGENLAMVQRVAKAEWEALQPKAKKAKLSDEQKAENKALESYVDTMNKAYGINKDYNNQLAGFQLLRKNGKITEEEYVKVVEDLIKQQKFYTDGLAEEEKQLKLVQKAWADTNKAQAKKDDEYFKSYDALKAQSAELKIGTSEIEFQLGLVGKTEEQQKKLTREHKVQNDLQKVQNELAAELNKIIAQGQDPELQASLEIIARENAAEKIKVINAGVALQAAQDMQKEFDAIKSSITDSIVTALFDGGKAGSKKLRDQVVSAFRNKITVVIDAVVNTALSGVLGSAAAGSASSGIVGSIGSSALGQMFGMGAGGLLASPLAYGAAIGTTSVAAGSQAAMLASQTGVFGAQGLAATSAAAGGTAGSISAAMSAIPGWGWALMAGVAVAAMLEGGETRAGGAYKLGAGGNAEFIQGPSGGQIMAKESAKMLEVTTQAINDTFKAIGSSTSVSSFLAGLESSDNGKGFAYATGTLSTGATFGDVNTFNANRGNKTPEEAFKEYNKQLNQSFIEALQVAPDVPLALTKIITDSLNGQEVSSLTDEATNTLLTAIKTTLTSVTLFKEGILSLPFESLKKLSFDAAAGLISAAGGLDNLNTKLLGFYENFYSDADKVTNLTSVTTKAFSDLGIVMPDVNAGLKEWYKQQVLSAMALDQSVPANAKATAGLLTLQDNVLGLSTSVNTAADAIKEATDKLNESARSADAVAVQLGLTTSIDLARNAANEAWAVFKSTLPQAAGYSEAEIVNFARDPAKMKNLSSADQNVINTFVSAIGDWSKAQGSVESTASGVVTTIDKVSTAYENAIKSITDQTTGFIVELSEIGLDSFTIALNKIKREGSKKLVELDALNPSSSTKVSSTGILNMSDYYAGQQRATSEWKVTGNDVKYAADMDKLSFAFSTAITTVSTSINSNIAIVDAWTDAQIKLLYAQKAQGEKVDLEKQYADLTKTSVSLLKEQRDALEESNWALFDQIQAYKTQELATQATKDYQLAMWEATGDTASAALRQRELATATKLAAGWTLSQIDNLYGAQEAAERAQRQASNSSSLLSILAQTYEITGDLALAESTLMWQRTKEIIELRKADPSGELSNATYNLWKLQDAAKVNAKATEEAALAAEAAAEAARELKSAYDALESARVSVANAFNAIKSTAEEAAKAVDSAKESITSGYISALDQQTQAQQTINDLIRDAAVEMKGFSDNIKEFLLQMSTTDLGADSKLSQLSALLADFNTTAGLAKGGDKAAYGSITGKASDLLSAGKEQFSTLAEFARFSSNIGNTLAELQTLADGKAGPLAEAIDPMVKAQADLLKANEDVAKWSKAISESGASTAMTVKDYALEWRTAEAANRKAQAELKEAQLLTRDIDMKLLDVLGQLKELIASYNSAKQAVVAAGGVVPTSTVTSTPAPTATSSGSTSAGSSGSTVLGLSSKDYISMVASSDITKDPSFVKLVENAMPTAIKTQEYGQWLSGFKSLSGTYYNTASNVDALKQEKWASLGLSGVPSFAVGTNSVPEDMFANIHKGERIIPEADNTELMQRLSSPMTQDNSELVLEIQRLNNRLATIESNTASTAGHAAKTARLLDRAMPDGDAFATRTAPAV